MMELDRRNLNRWRSQQNRSLYIPNGGGHWREPEEYTSSLCSHCNSNTQIFHTFFFSLSLSLSLFFFFFFFSLLLPLLLLRNLKREREEWTGGTNLTFWLSFFLFLGFSRNKYGNFFNKRKWDFVCRLVGWVSVFQSVTNRVELIDKHPSFFFFFFFNCRDKHPFHHLFSNFK